MNQFITNFKYLLLEQIQHPICLLLSQMLLILLVTRLFGFLFLKIKQPVVIGEIVAGIFLGVSGFGALFPKFFSFVFPASSFANLEVLSKIGLAFFMFIIGMELDLNELKKKAKTVFVISISSLFIPFLFGVALSYFLFPYFNMQGISFFIFSLFLGIALSITAFPVLARIVRERGLHTMPLGTLVLSCAAMADVLAWCMLAVIIAFAKAGSLSNALITLLCAIAFILFMFFVVRRFLEKLIARLRVAHYGDRNIMVLSFIVLLFSCFVAEAIGIHMLFGAFLAGAVIPNNEKLKHSLNTKLEDVSLLLLLPIFFVLNGLRLHIDLLNTSHLWLICLVVIFIATLAKFIGSAVPAKLMKLSWKDSLCVGALMNTRGLMELVVLNIGFELGILSAQLFAILVLMAILTTIATNPILDLIDFLFRRK